MGWRIIEIEQKCFLKTFNNNLLIYDVSKKSIPMSDIDVLIINNQEICISIYTINELIANGVCIINCNQKQLPFSYTLGYKIQKQSYINFQQQLKWTNEFKTKCWNWISFIKIKNQLDLLDFYGLITNDLRNELNSTSDFLNTMFEAKVANYFFKQMYQINFNRQKSNIINEILDYGYTIITNMVARSLVKKGLNLQISFYHGSIYTTYPLAYDVVEVFRIVIDLFCSKIYYEQKLKLNASINRQIKSCLLDFIANYKIEIYHKYEYLNNSIDKVIDWIINDSLNEHTINYDFDLEIINAFIYETDQANELQEQL